MLTLGFDITILNVVLPTIATDLATGTDTLQWIVNAYVLLFAGLMLPLGALGDRYGRRKLTLIGLALFAAASVLAAWAQAAGPVIAARALMGVGGCGTPEDTAGPPIPLHAEQLRSQWGHARPTGLTTRAASQPRTGERTVG